MSSQNKNQTFGYLSLHSLILGFHYVSDCQYVSALNEGAYPDVIRVGTAVFRTGS